MRDKAINFILPTLVILMLFTSCMRRTTGYEKFISKHRTEYKAKFNTEEHAPLKGKQLKDMRFFEIDPSYRVDAKVVMLENQESKNFRTSSGEDRMYQPYARLEFFIDDSAYHLIGYKSPTASKIPEYKDLLFVPFNDYTNGEESYGGGRYLDLYTDQIVKGIIILDFNKAYNPYCAYSSGYSCPIPPLENKLEVAIEAGEKNYAGEYISH